MHYFVKKKLYFPFLLKNEKCTSGQCDKKHFTAGLQTDTAYTVQPPNLNLKLTFLNKKVIINFVYDIQLLIKSRNRKPCFAESAFADFVSHFTLIFDSCVFYSKRKTKFCINKIICSFEIGIIFVTHLFKPELYFGHI